MKEQLSNFRTYLKVGFLFLGYIVLRAGLRSGNDLFTISGVLILVVVGIILLINLLYKSKVTEKETLQTNVIIEEFKRSSRKVKVDLQNLKIISNSWNEDIVISEDKYGGLDELAGYKNHNIINVKRNLNTVLLEIPIKNDILQYQVNIESDLTTLQMKFAIQKETTLYVDSKSEESYLDLEFLDK